MPLPRRPDLIVYVNGLPLVVGDRVEGPGQYGLRRWMVAIDQLAKYKAIAPDLFGSNLLLVGSDGLMREVDQRLEAAATVMRRDRMVCVNGLRWWRVIELEDPANMAAALDVALEVDERGNIVKKMAGYHQFGAVRKARAEVIGAMKRGAGLQRVSSSVAASGPDQRLEAAATLRIRHGAYLPHWTRDGATYAVTFRLADSLPQAVLLGWQREREEIVARALQMNRPLSQHEEERLEHLYSEKVEKFLDAGSGHCWMNRPEIADLVENGLKHFDGERYCLFAWCIMPNHVHVVVHPLTGHSLDQITHSWKSYTATHANRLLGRRGEFWQKESYDHLIRDQDDLNHAVKYTLENPRKAGLKDWRWSGSNLSGSASSR